MLDDHLALQENALEATRVRLLRLNELNRPVLQVVEDDELADAVVLQTRLNNGFLEVTVESEHLKYVRNTDQKRNGGNRQDFSVRDKLDRVGHNFV